MPSRSQRHMTQMLRPTSGGVQPITLGIYFTGFQASESIGSGAALGTLSTQGTVGTASFALTDSDGTRVALTGTNNVNVVRGATPWDYETHPLVTFTVSVSGVTPTIAPTSFQMRVQNVLETVLAALTLSANTVAEGSPLNTVVGAIQNRTAGSTLSLFDNGNERFAISGTNLVTTSIPTDYETLTSHNIIIRETHPDAAPRDTSFTINVTNVLEGNLNALTLNNNSVNENMAIGTVVGTLQGKTSGSTLALNLTGAAVGKFTLSGTDILTAAVFDYEAASSYSISITETYAEAANSPRVTPLTINVGDVFEGTDSTPNAFTFTDQTGVALSTPITSNTITISGIDLPSPLTITGGQYSINGGTFASAATTVNNGDTVAVRVTSSSSNSTAVSATLTIGGVSDTFTATTLAAAGFGPFTLAWTSADTERTNVTFTLTPAPAVGDVVTMFLDNDSGITSPYAAVNNTIDSAEAAAGVLTFAGITVPLPLGLSYAMVNVARSGFTDVQSNIVPKTLVSSFAFTSSAAVTNPENTVLAHTLTASEAATFALIVGGADNAKFQITSSTLQWASNGTKDREAPDDANGDNIYEVTVQATATVGGATATQTINVTVSDVVEGTATTFWDPAQKGADITLTNGNLTATANAATANHNVRTNTTLGAGKRVVKLTTTDCNFSSIGLANSSFTPTDGNWSGATSNACSWNTNTGNLVREGFPILFSTVWSASTVPVWLAFEDTGSVINFYISTNGSTWGSAVAVPNSYLAGTKKLIFSPYAVGDNVTLDANPTFSGLTGGLAWDAAGGADTLAPFLDLPTGVKTGSTTATLTVRTDEGNGTWYGVNSAAAPSKAQIKAGQTSTGAASSYAFNQTITATGVQSRNASGLTASTPYTMHYMHEDLAGNQSNVASASAFTTDAAGGGTVVFDAVSQKSDPDGVSSIQSFTQSWLHTPVGVPTGVVVATAYWQPSLTNPTSVKYGTKTMTLESSVDNTSGIRLYSLANPDPGPQTVEIVYTQLTYPSSSAITVTGGSTTDVLRTPPTAKTGLVSAPGNADTLTVPSASGELVVDAIFAYTLALNVGAGQTVRASPADIGAQIFRMSTETSTTSSTDMSWTFGASAGSDSFGHVGASFNPA